MTLMSEMAGRRVREVHIAPLRTTVDRRADGTLYMQSPDPLGPYPAALTARIEHWARVAPDRTCVAERDAMGNWTRVSYADVSSRIRHLAQALIDRKLSSDRPVVIVSGNSIDHLLLALAAMYAGVPHAPIAPAYSLLAREHGALQYVFDLLQPGLVFAANGAPFERALRATLPSSAELVVSTSAPDGLASTPLASLAETPITAAVDAAHARVNGDTIAKILFTSGSTGRPKAVVNTQRMLCSNQEMLRTVMPFLSDEPPVLCDWLPWNHTFGGNHNIGIALYNGGSFYIDEGKPTPEGIKATVRNLREIASTAYYNVPRGYEVLMPYLQRDEALRATFFSRVKLLFYAAAGLGQRFWDELRDVAIEACGEEILMMTGLGATESAPYAISTGKEGAASGVIGLPVPGVQLKLVPAGTKIEARLKGPNVTPGFWRQDDITANAFDEEGYYKLGDAVRFIEPGDPSKGLMFDGRLNEDFKLSTGTWVSVGPLRTRFLQHFGRLAQDVVIAGHDRFYLGALVVPNLEACAALCSGLSEAPTPTEVLRHPVVRARFQLLLDEFAALQTGSAATIARLLLLEERPSLDAREVTDKGSLNQRAVLTHRAPLVDDLYATPPPSPVIICGAVRTA
jgi:feruloyl-CoA synthase